MVSIAATRWNLFFFLALTGANWYRCFDPTGQGRSSLDRLKQLKLHERRSASLSDLLSPLTRRSSMRASDWEPTSRR